MKLKLCLAGHYAGRDCILAGVRFIEGKAELRGEMQDVLSVARYLGKCYQALPENSDEFEKAMEDPRMVNIYGEQKSSKDSSADQDEDVSRKSTGSTGDKPTEEDSAVVSGSDKTSVAGSVSVSDRGGHEDSRLSDSSTLGAAIYGLDPDDDDNWTQDGYPAVAAVAAAARRAGVTRADITYEVGDWDRELARADHK